MKMKNMSIMNCYELMQKRKSNREFNLVKIEENQIKKLAEAASLAPSCYNKQPWRFVFIKDEQKRKELQTAISEGNQWASKGSLLIAVYSKKEYDCVAGEREYYLFDTGMAVGFLILRATELGLATHIIAGFDDKKAKEILEIPTEMNLIALIVVGKLTEQEIIETTKRPERKVFEEFSKII